MSVQGIKNLAELVDEATDKDELRTIPLSIIDPDPDQPRTHFDEGRLNALADSIKAQGIIEPLIVSPHPDDPRRYLLAAGERRWRAAELAGLAEVPVVIREFSEEQRLAIQLVENIDREALSPTEESLAILRLTEKGMKPKDIAEMLGKSAAWVSLRRKIARNHEIIKPFVDEGITKDVETLAMLVDLSKLDAAIFHTVAQEKHLSRVQVRSVLNDAKQAKLEQPLVEKTPLDPIPESSNTELTSTDDESEGLMQDKLYYVKAQDTIQDLLGISTTIRAPGPNKPGEIKIKFRDRAELEDIRRLLNGS